MRIYVPQALDDYELCHPIHQEDFDRICRLVNGHSRKDSWTPIEMQIISNDGEGRLFSPSDSPWLGSHALIFRPCSVEVAQSHLTQNGELLPLECREGEVVMYNPTRILDALDEAASTILRFGNQKIMMIKRYVFQPNVVRHVDIFKIPNLLVSPTFVSEAFVKLWDTAGLKGLEFKEIWNSVGEA